MSCGCQIIITMSVNKNKFDCGRNRYHEDIKELFESKGKTVKWFYGESLTDIGYQEQLERYKDYDVLIVVK